MLRSNPNDLINALNNFHKLLITFGVIPYKFHLYITSNTNKFLHILDLAYRAIALVIFIVIVSATIQAIHATTNGAELIFRTAFMLILELTLIYGLITNITAASTYLKIFNKLFNLQLLISINFKELKTSINFILIIAFLRWGNLLMKDLSMLATGWGRIEFVMIRYSQGWIILLQLQVAIYLWVVFRHLKFYNQILVKFHQNIREEEVSRMFGLSRCLMMECFDIVELMHRLYSVNIGLRFATDLGAMVDILYNEMLHDKISARPDMVEPVCAIIFIVMAYHLLESEVGFKFFVSVPYAFNPRN